MFGGVGIARGKFVDNFGKAVDKVRVWEYNVIERAHHA